MAETNAKITGLQFNLGAKNAASETLQKVRQDLKGLKSEASQAIKPKMDMSGLTAAASKVKDLFKGLSGGKVAGPSMDLDGLKDQLAQAKQLQSELAQAYKRARAGTDAAYDRGAKLTDYDVKFKTPAFTSAQAGISEALDTEKQIKSEYDTATKSVTDLQAQIKGLGASNGKSGQNIVSMFKDAGKAVSGLISGSKQAASAMGNLVKFITMPERAVLRIGSAFGGNLLSSIKRATQGITAFGRRFTHVLSYRAFRRFVSMIYQGLTQGKDNLYAWSKIVGGQFSQSMDKLASSALFVKNAIGSIAEPIINAVTPAMTQLMDTAAGVFNSIAEGIAVVTGASTFSKAIKSVKEYKSELGKLAGIDEVHVIGSDQGNISDQFQTQKVSDVLKDLWDMKRYEDFGKEIASRLNKGIKSIDNWFNNKLRPQGVKWARIAAKVGNGIVDGFHWNFAGRTLGDGLNAITDTINTFFTTFRFDRLGTGVMNTINGFFDSVDFNLLGQTLANKINSGIDFAFGMVRAASPFKYGKRFAELINSWFSTIDWGKAGDNVAQFINKFSTNVSVFFQTADWGMIKESITTFINNAVSGVDWNSVGHALGSFFSETVGLLSEVIDGIDWEKLASGIGTALEEVNWDGILVNFGNALFKAFKGIISGLFDSKTGRVAIALSGAISGMLAGLAIGGPAGALVGAVAGGSIATIGGGILANKSTAGTPNGYKRVFGRANGGMVTRGDLFYASENGPEFVGTLGGAQTAVANNGSIVEGVRRGVMEALLMANANGGNGNKEIHITVDLDGRKVGEQTVSYINGETKRTGNSPLYAY